MVLTEQEIEAINELLNTVDEKVNDIIHARDDVRALLRIASSINNDTIENGILSDAKSRAKTASEEITTLLI